MTIRIVPISAVRQKLRDILATLEATGEPYCITQYSRPKAVLVRYADYNALVDQAAKGHPHIVCRAEISGGNPPSAAPVSPCATLWSGSRPANRWTTSSLRSRM